MIAEYESVPEAEAPRCRSSRSPWSEDTVALRAPDGGAEDRERRLALVRSRHRRRLAVRRGLGALGVLALSGTAWIAVQTIGTATRVEVGSLAIERQPARAEVEPDGVARVGAARALHPRKPSGHRRAARRRPVQRRSATTSVAPAPEPAPEPTYETPESEAAPEVPVAEPSPPAPAPVEPASQEFGFEK